jgi:hypothetical protein
MQALPFFLYGRLTLQNYHIFILDNKVIKLTLKQATELERLMAKERAGAIQNGIADLDIILGYYLVGLGGYVDGGYYPPN